jgi:hypothetical protein
MKKKIFLNRFTTEDKRLFHPVSGFLFPPLAKTKKCSRYTSGNYNSSPKAEKEII